MEAISILGGYKVKSCAIVHINNQYVRHGDLDINELFTVEDITADAAMLQPDVSDNIDSIREYMLQPEEPTDDIGEHCFSPYFCGFFGHCTKHLPTPNVFDVAGARTSTKLKCYNKGIISFEDLNNEAFISAKKNAATHANENVNTDWLDDLWKEVKKYYQVFNEWYQDCFLKVS